MPTLPAWPKSVGTPPKKVRMFDEYAWADYVELLCLADPDGILTPSDVIDTVRPNSEDIEETNAISDSLHNVDGTELAADADDEWEARIRAWFEHLAYRANAFGDAYPFEFEPVTDDGVGPTLSRRYSNDDDVYNVEVQLYLALLFAANLRYCIAEKSGLTRGFERLCYWLLKEHLGSGAEVHLFGTGPPGNAPAQARYTGTTYDRLKKLGEDLRAKLLADPADWPATSGGDAGIDLVAWYPFDDGQPTMFMLFAQCAATEEWDTKQFSSHAAKWIPHFRFFAPPSNVVFVPLCFRRTDGQFHTMIDIGQSVFVDRLRVIRTLNGSTDYVNDAVLNQAEDLARLRNEPFE